MSNINRFAVIIGSSTAFNIILSVSAVGLLTSYIIVISVLLRRRLVGEPFPASRWRLGAWGVPIGKYLGKVH